MITLDELQNLKLVLDENVADEQRAKEYIEYCVQQGSQGWGVRRDVSVVLKLARDLKIALALAATADEAQRKLKGEQMAHGRTKKMLKRDTQMAEDLSTELVAERLIIKGLQEQIEKLQNEVQAWRNIEELEAKADDSA